MIKTDDESRRGCACLYDCVLLSLTQSGDDGVLARGRRDVAVSSFWKRLHHRPPPQQQPAARDKIASFWKRAHRAHDSLASFWKRAPPGSQAFWKRFLAEPDDVRTMLAAQLNKKNDVLSAPGGPQQQRRANEAAGRRPEFNPTGW